MTSSLKKARKASRFINIHGLKTSGHHPTIYRSKSKVVEAVTEAITETAQKTASIWRRIIEFIKGVFLRPVTA